MTLEQQIQEIIAQVGATSIKDMGKVMGAFNKTVLSFLLA